MVRYVHYKASILCTSSTTTPKRDVRRIVGGTFGGFGRRRATADSRTAANRPLGYRRLRRCDYAGGTVNKKRVKRSGDVRAESPEKPNTGDLVNDGSCFACARASQSCRVL